MNILYVSSLSHNKSHGPSFSVPAQVNAQKKYDNIYWFNTNNDYLEHWGATGVFRPLAKNPKCRLSDFPSPFNQPDIIVFEGFYFPVHCKLAIEAKKLGVPYVIIPRGSLTKGAQRIKPLKKKIGNVLLFNRYVKNAATIQYLTKQEYLDSGNKWNEKHFIMPNGIEMKRKTKQWNTRKQLKGVYIGRMDLVHKGIDLLIEASDELENIFKENECTISLYGPELNGYKKQIEEEINEKELNNIIKVNEGLYGEEKERVLLDADFFIMTSRFEGHPMGLIEALSYGLPCLVTVGTNMSKKINNADAGWTAENNVESIKSAFLEMFSERTSFKEKGINALKLSEKYDWKLLSKKSHDEFKNHLKNTENL